MDLASYEDLGELSEETFQAMVGDLLAARRRVKELTKLEDEYTKQRTRLISTKAYDCWSSYRSAQLELEAFDEQVAPALARLERERADKQKLVEILEGHLKKLLPEGIWIRYGDEAIRRVDESAHDYYINQVRTGVRSTMTLPSSPIDTVAFHAKSPQLHLAKWKDVAPIPPTITRTGSKHEGSSWVGQKLRDSYNYGFLSDRYAPHKGMGIPLLGFIGLPLAYEYLPYAIPLTIILFLAFPYFLWRDGGM